MEDLPELRKVHNVLTSQIMTPVIEFERFSSMSKLTHAIAYVMRFISASRKMGTPSDILLSTTELLFSERVIIKTLQSNCFSDEIACLKRGQSVHKTSKLNSLAPFVDEEGLLRVGGRLQNASYDYYYKHPILLPRHRVTELIFRREHWRLLHVGPLGLLNSIRSTYWPLSGRNLARRVVHQCHVCFHAKPKPFAPATMGNLPEARVVPSFPFSHCGIDYAGPVMLRASRLRNAKTYKAYIALFICLSTKALHLEIVTDLTTNGFIATLRRFYSRRGMPSHLYSDNGTNFIGANKELKAFFNRHAKSIVSDCAEKQIHWHFIPPRSPHFGGLWEAGVKAVKHHLKRVVGAQTLTYENYNTLLVQIESILNSRPLTALSTDPNDYTPLTPAHFLIGRKFTTILNEPEMRISNKLSKFQLTQCMLQSFWTKWKADYVHTLQQRAKWTTPGRPQPSLGQLVILVDNNTPLMKWPLGRIVELHPGLDNVVRVATVRTATGTFKRTIMKLCPLPTPEQDTS